MASIDEKIAALNEAHQKKIAQLEALKEKQEARKLNALIKGKRSDDTRRKILAGAMVLEKADKDEAARQRLMDGLDKYLTRDDDRALFGLSKKPKSATTEQPKPTALPSL